MTTEQLAQTHGISVVDMPPALTHYAEPCPRSPREIAERAVILQGVVAVGHGVEPEPVIELG